MSERMKATIRLVVMIIFAVNAVLAGKGYSHIDNNQLTEILSYIIAAVAAVWAWWKNNNITEAASQAQEVLRDLKSLGKEAQNELSDGRGDDE